MGPGLYSDIGKKARDLLYKDYLTDTKFTLTTFASNGVAITSSGTKKNDLVSGEIQTQIKNKGYTTDIKVNSDSKLFTTITADEIAPGFKTILSFVVPDQKSGKLEIQYLHENVGVHATVGLNASPIVNVAGVFGSSALALGADIGFDSASGNLTKYNAGLSYKNTDFIASLTLNDKGDTLNASYYHLVNPVTSTAVGAEISHCISSSENTLTFGTQHSLDPLTTVKARVNNYGIASALVQHEWRPKSLVTLSGEVDTKAIEKSSKVGLALVLKP